jgi:membrane protein YdbS with pleckstrin-like domain
MTGGSEAMERNAWTIAIVIWLAGAAVLAVLWQWHPKSELLDVLLGFVLYVVAFFYILALPVLRDTAARWLSRRSDRRPE